jgi:hypothetical protein
LFVQLLLRDAEKKRIKCGQDDKNGYFYIIIAHKKTQTALNSYFFTAYASLYGGKGRGQ